MKTVKILLCILIINFQVHANEYRFSAHTNIASAIDLTEGVKWSLDGGLFLDAKNGIYIRKPGTHKILLLNPNGEIKNLEVIITGGLPAETKTSDSLYIDYKAPELHYSWSNAVKVGGQVVVGPNSQLKWNTDDPNATIQVYINEKLSKIINSPLPINQDMSSIKIKTIDEFNNESITNIPFSKNFSSPPVDWKIAEPSHFENNKWYIVKDVKLVVSQKPGVSYKLNESNFDINDQSTKIENNSQLTAFDSLGNESSKDIISWIVDDKPPSLLVETLGTEQVNIKKINVKTNQDVRLSTVDEGVGLLDAFFFNKKGIWEPLPTTLAFFSPGNYKIKIKARDKLGNSLLNKINIKVKQANGGSK